MTALSFEDLAEQDFDLKIAAAVDRAVAAPPNKDAFDCLAGAIIRLFAANTRLSASCRHLEARLNRLAARVGALEMAPLGEATARAPRLCQRSASLRSRRCRRCPRVRSGHAAVRRVAEIHPSRTARHEPVAAADRAPREAAQGQRQAPADDAGRPRARSRPWQRGLTGAQASGDRQGGLAARRRRCPLWPRSPRSSAVRHVGNDHRAAAAGRPGMGREKTAASRGCGWRCWAR
jgi:hypothetical protein